MLGRVGELDRHALLVRVGLVRSEPRQLCAVTPVAVPSVPMPVVRRIPKWSDFRELLAFKPPVLPGRRRRLRKGHTIEDLRRIAKQRTPKAIFDYVDGAAGDELSLRRSREAFQDIRFLPRVLRDVAQVDTSTTILGQRSALPLICAPTGFTRMMHHEGEVAVARAAGRAGIPYALSTMGTMTPEEVAAGAPDTRRWFQLYLWQDRTASKRFVERAGAAGYDTLMLTVDTPVAGPRLRDARNGMTIPPTLSMRTILDGARHPHWWMNFLTTDPIRFASLDGVWDGGIADLASQVFDPAVTWDDVDYLREVWKGNLVIKGVTATEDARLAVEHGADAIVISNHGGRQLDRCVPPLELLPSVVAAVGERCQVFLDGGVMSGTDIVAAVAQGATSVMVGRAYLYGLMAGGEPGVDHALGLLRRETASTMQLLGATKIEELTTDCLDHTDYLDHTGDVELSTDR